MKYKNYGNSKDQIFRVFPEFSKPQHDDQKKTKCFVESIEGVDAGEIFKNFIYLIPNF